MGEEECYSEKLHATARACVRVHLCLPAHIFHQAPEGQTSGRAEDSVFQATQMIKGRGEGKGKGVKIKLAPKDYYLNQCFSGGKAKGAKARNRVHACAAQTQKCYNAQGHGMRVHCGELLPCISDPSYYFQWIVLWNQNILEKKKRYSLFHNEFVMHLGTR